MRVIYAIDPKTQNAARVTIGCDAYQQLFIDFLVTNGYDAAITDEATKPVRSAAEEATVNRLMEAFKHQLDTRVLN
jgi:hypothetical protein